MPPKKVNKKVEAPSKTKKKVLTEETPVSRSRSARKPPTPKKQDTKAKGKNSRS